MLSLAAQKRDISQKPEEIRASGFIPAVVYGPKHDSTPIMIDQIAFQKAWAEAGHSGVISLTGLDNPVEALIYDISVHAITSKPQHADFYAVEKGKKVHMHIPVLFTGVAPVEKLGGVVVKVLHEIEIEAEAHNIPHDVTVDLTELTAVGQHITAKDVALPKGVTLLTEPEEIVVSASEQSVEEVEPAPVAEAAAAPAAETKEK
jgi:large subunit ribosomal protein L25